MTPAGFLVVRYAAGVSEWARDPRVYPTEIEDTHGMVPERLFPDRAAAEGEVARLDRLERRRVSVGPSLLILNPESADELAAAARAVGLPEPDFTPLDLPAFPQIDAQGRQFIDMKLRDEFHAAVRAWWEGVADRVTPDQNAALWDELFSTDGHHFYGVVKVLWKEQAVNEGG